MSIGGVVFAVILAAGDEIGKGGEGSIERAVGAGDGQGEFEAGGDGTEILGSEGGAILDAIEDEAGEGHGDAGVDFMGGVQFAVVDLAGAGFFLGDEGGDVTVGDAPVEGGAEVEDIGGGGESTASNLLGGDVIGGALDALLDGADGTGLAEVDDFYSLAVVDEDVVGFDVGMDVALAVQGGEALGDLDEDFDEGVEGVGALGVEGGAVEEFHKEVEFGDAEHFAAFDEAEGFAEVGVIELGSDGEFLFGLFKKAVVFGGAADDAFEGVDLSGAFFGDGVDGGSRPVAEAGKDFEVGDIGENFHRCGYRFRGFSGFGHASPKLGAAKRSAGAGGGWCAGSRLRRKPSGVNALGGVRASTKDDHAQEHRHTMNVQEHRTDGAAA